MSEHRLAHLALCLSSDAAIAVLLPLVWQAMCGIAG